MPDTIAIKTTLYYSPTLTGTYVDIGALTALTLPKGEMEDVKTTDLSNVDQVHTYISGIEEPGTAEGTVKFDAAKFVLVNGLKGTSQFFKASCTEGTVCTFGGYVKGISISQIQKGNLMSADFSIKVSGKVTTVAGNGTQVLTAQKPGHVVHNKKAEIEDKAEKIAETK